MIRGHGGRFLLQRPLIGAIIRRAWMRVCVCIKKTPPCIQSYIMTREAETQYSTISLGLVESYHYCHMAPTTSADAGELKKTKWTSCFVTTHQLTVCFGRCNYWWSRSQSDLPRHKVRKHCHVSPIGSIYHQITSAWPTYFDCLHKWHRLTQKLVFNRVWQNRNVFTRNTIRRS